MFLSVCVTVSLGRRLVPWTIVDLQREDRTFRTLFSEVVAGKFDCVEVNDELKRATLSQVLIGSDKDKLMVTSASQSVFNVCEEFGKYVRFVHCASEEVEDTGDSDSLPQCQECNHLERVSRPKKKS